MSISVRLHEIKESSKSNLKYCEKCSTVPTWEFRLSPTTLFPLAYSCSEHTNEVLFDMMYGRITADQNQEGARGGPGL